MNQIYIVQHYTSIILSIIGGFYQKCWHCIIGQRVSIIRQCLVRKTVHSVSMIPVFFSPFHSLCCYLQLKHYYDVDIQQYVQSVWGMCSLKLVAEILSEELQSQVLIMKAKSVLNICVTKWLVLSKVFLFNLDIYQVCIQVMYRMLLH